MTNSCLNPNDEFTKVLTDAFGYSVTNLMVKKFFNGITPLNGAELSSNKEALKFLNILPKSEASRQFSVFGYKLNYNKNISHSQLIKLKKLISNINNKLYEMGYNHHYQLWNPKLSSESSYNWSIIRKEQPINIDNKIARLKQRVDDGGILDETEHKKLLRIKAKREAELLTRTELQKQYFSENTVSAKVVLAKMIAKGGLEISRDFLKLVDEDLKITYIEGDIDSNDVNYIAKAVFIRDKNEIQLSNKIEPGKYDMAILHEIAHSITHKYLGSNTEASKDLDRIFRLYKESSKSPRNKYYTLSLDEFVAGIFSDPFLQNELKSIPPIQSIKSYKNLFEELVDRIITLFDLPKSLHEQAFNIITNIISEKVESQRNLPNRMYMEDSSIKPNVILPIGTSGSGKSTFIKSLPQENLVVIEPDAMRVEFTGDINDKSKDKEIYIEAANRAIIAIKQGKQVVFDTTNLTKEKRRPFIEAIKKALPDASIQYKLMELNPELAKQRIKAQIARGENRANVSDETIDRHAESYKQMLEDIKSEPITNFDSQPSQAIKPGVEELFDSNPELANQVYEALGFEQGLNFIYNKRTGNLINTVEKNKDICLFTQKATSDYLKSKNINSQPFILFKVQSPLTPNKIAHTLTIVKINDKTYFYDMPQSEFIKPTGNNVKQGNINLVEGIFEKDYKPYLIEINKENLINKYGISENDVTTNLETAERASKRLFNNKVELNQITPQQKQQALQQYSQYLQQNPNGNIEQFKSWVEEFNRNKFVQESGSLSKISQSKINNLQNTVEYQLLVEQDDDLVIKGGQSYVYLNEKDANRFNFILEKTKEFPKEFKVTKKITKYEKISNTLKYNSYNEYIDFYYIKLNNNKKSNLYQIVNKETGEIISSKVRVLHLSQDSKSKIAEQYGLEFKPTKVFSANRSIAFALYRQKPSKAKYIAQAKKYLYDAIKFLNLEETNLKINLDKIEELLNSFPEDMWDYINTTYSPEDSTNINASITLQNKIKFNLPKLGLLQEIEKITKIPLQGVSFKNYDRTGLLAKVFKYSKLNGKWGETITIDSSSMTTKELKASIKYYLKSKNYFKPSSTEENIRKYAEHRNIDYNELKELIFGDLDKALDNILYNTTGNSDTIELSKWRESIREYDWQMVELFSKPYENFQNTVKDRITEKFKDRILSNGISHLDYFFNSGSFNWLNINFNNISGQYYNADMETQSDVGVKTKMGGITNPFEMKIYQKPKPGENFLQEKEIFNRLAAILHEPFHALHALSYGTKEEIELRNAFYNLYKTDFGKEMMNQVFGSGYNKGQEVSYDTLYKEFTAFSTQLMLYPKQWINKTDLRSNDIVEFILKIQSLQDKTYTEIVKTQQKIGTSEKTITEEEQIKLSFLEKLYNYLVKALQKIIPLSKKFLQILPESKIVSKQIIEDVFGTVEETVTKTLKLPENIKKSKEQFLEAMEELQSTINILMQIDSKLFSSENATNFFTNNKFNQESNSLSDFISQNKNSVKDTNSFFDRETSKAADILQRISESDSKLNLLAKHLIPFVENNNVTIYFDDVPSYKEGEFGLDMDAMGFYEPVSNTIRISNSGNTRTLIHEILHSLTYHSVRNNKEMFNDLNILFQEASDKLYYKYPLQDIDEFMVHLFLNSDFIKELEDIPPVDNIGKYKNLLQQIFDTIFKRLGLNYNNSLYKQAFEIVTNVLDNNSVNESDLKDSVKDYISWFKYTPIIEKAVKKWGDMQALTDSINDKVFFKKGEILSKWGSFEEWMNGTFDNMSSKSKEDLSDILAYAYLSKIDLKTNDVGLSDERIEELKYMVKNPYTYNKTISFVTMINLYEGSSKQMSFEEFSSFAYKLYVSLRDILDDDTIFNKIKCL
jgi:predicted kinase